MSSGFISETEIANQRQKRQEEWEKVRTAEQPVEAPEEDYDPRSLFDRLQEQKQKKEFEYEEAHKLSKFSNSWVRLSHSKCLSHERIVKTLQWIYLKIYVFFFYMNT